MKVIGDYRANGYAHLQDVVPAEVAAAFLERLKRDLGEKPINLGGVTQYPNLLARPALDIYGHQYYPCCSSCGG